MIRVLDVKVTTLRPGRVRDPEVATDDDRADFELLGAGADQGGFSLDMEGPNSVLFSFVAGARRRGLGTGPGPDAGPSPAVVFRFISGELTDRRTGAPGKRIVKLQRTWFAYYEPVGERTETGRGPPPPTRATVLLLPGIFGNPEPTLDSMVLTLRQRGYAVLRMLCQPSRFTERIVLRIDPGNPEGNAKEIAGQYNDRLAECAYAAEGAWAFVDERRPQVKDLARLAIGMSGGAISLPTVVAREKDRYAGAVLIGGAADCWLTIQRSNYQEMIGAVSVAWQGEEPTEELQRTLDRFYLQNARLDPFHTGAALHGKPVLVLQGLADLAVPSRLGDVLWERLQRPERWTYPLGHEMLFMGLPAEFPRLAGWLDAAIEKVHQPVGHTP